MNHESGPNLRWLKRPDRPSRVRANSAADFVQQRVPSRSALLFRRRLFLLAGLVVSCVYVIVGVWLLLDDQRFGYVIVGFFGLCGTKWARLALLSPEAILAMRFPRFHFLASKDFQPKGSSSQAQGGEQRVHGKPAFSRSNSGLWDWELDGNT